VNDLEISQIAEIAYFKRNLLLSVETYDGLEEKTSIYSIDCEKFLAKTYEKPTIT